MSRGQMFGRWRESALVLKAQATRVTGPGRSWGLGSLEETPLVYIGKWGEREWNTEGRALGATWGVGAGLYLGGTLGREEVRSGRDPQVAH